MTDSPHLADVHRLLHQAHAREADIWHHLSLAAGGPVGTHGDAVDAIASLRRETDQAGAAELRIRKALNGHPTCDVHPDDDPITCGWKRVVADITHALEEDD